MKRFILSLALLALVVTVTAAAQDSPQFVAKLGQVAVVQDASGAVAIVPGNTLEDSQDPPLPDVVVAWTSAGTTVTLNFYKSPSEGDAKFRNRVKDDTAFFKDLFPPDPPASK